MAMAVVEGCLLPKIGKTNYCGSIFGSKVGQNEGGILGQTCCLHWVEREPYVGVPKEPYGRSHLRPTVGFILASHLEDAKSPRDGGLRTRGLPHEDGRLVGIPSPRLLLPAPSLLKEAVHPSSQLGADRPLFPQAYSIQKILRYLRTFVVYNL